MFQRGFFIMVVMSSILVYANDAPPEKPTEESKGFFKKIFSKVELPVLNKKQEVIEEKPIEEKAINPAEKFPDPIFYDAIYPQIPTEESLLWVYNDKSYYENQHIPPILNYAYIVDDLFKIIPYYDRTPELLLILESIQNREDIDLNKQDKFGNTLLHYAIRYHNRSAFEKLLMTRKVNPNICNFSYICPIHLSIYKEDTYELNRLITYGADLHYSNDRFEMPMITAIKLHHIDAVYTIAKRHKEKGISNNEIDYIVFTAKEEGLDSLAKDLYLFFMLGREFEY